MQCPHTREENYKPHPQEKKKKRARVEKEKKETKRKNMIAKKIIKMDIFSKTVIFRTIRVPNHCESEGIW